MNIAELIFKYNDAGTGLFKNNAPGQGINALRLRGFVEDLGNVLSGVTESLPYTLRTEWIEDKTFPTIVFGLGTAVLANSVAGFFGLLSLETNAANGGAYVTTSKILLEQTLLIKTRMVTGALSTAPQAYYYHYGFKENVGNRNQVDGIYFEYSHDINGGNWVINSYKASVLTQILTTVPVTALTPYNLEVRYIPGVGATFRINDIVVGFIAQADIPVVAMNYANGLRKYNGNNDMVALIDSDLLIYKLAV